MKWYLNRKVNYFPFDIYTVNVGYTKNQWKNAGAGFSNTFYYYRNDFVSSYRGQTDLNKIVKYLDKHFGKKYVETKGAMIEKLAIEFLKITQKTFSSKVNLKKHFADFLESQAELFGIFQIPEYCQLFLTDHNQKLLKKFGLCRDRAAKEIIQGEKIYRTMLGKLIGVSKHNSLMLLPFEIEKILSDGKLPADLSLRKTFCLYTHKKQEQIYWNQEADAIFKKIIKPKIIYGDQLSGQVAFPGRYRGLVYVALNENNFKNIPKNAVLVCSMTRYDIVQYLPKVKAIITDQGGITCHAAIIARELKVPTIIGTYSATDFFRTGDQIEVDAINGIAKLIKRDNK